MHHCTDHPVFLLSQITRVNNVYKHVQDLT